MTMPLFLMDVPEFARVPMMQQIIKDYRNSIIVPQFRSILAQRTYQRMVQWLETSISDWDFIKDPLYYEKGRLSEKYIRLITRNIKKQQKVLGKK